MRAVTKLLSLLLATPGGATVASIGNPKLEQKFIREDPGLRKKGAFGIRQAVFHTMNMTTFFMEALAARHPGRLSLIHYFPGLVLTDLAYKSPLPGVAKLLWRYVMVPLSARKAVPLEECGDRVLFLASGRFMPQGSKELGADGQMGSGSYRVDWDGETFPANEDTKSMRDSGVVDEIWEHTMKIFEEIETKQKLDI